MNYFKILDSKLFIPEKIRQELINGHYQLDSIGMSGSSIRIYGDKVLKIQKLTKEAQNELSLLQFLHEKFPVPDIYAFDESNGQSCILMSKCPGKMACDPSYMENTGIQIKMLANTLKQLWKIDISNCPVDNRISIKLKQAEYNVKHGLVNIENVDPSTFGENGFKDPSHLLQWLYENMPKEEPVFSHGDFCLPNIFGDGEKPTGVIDLGRGGIADKWCDIALCYRSLADNYSGKYAKNGGSKNNGIDCFFKELGFDPDFEKIRYYILLDELF